VTDLQGPHGEVGADDSDCSKANFSKHNSSASRLAWPRRKQLLRHRRDSVRIAGRLFNSKDWRKPVQGFQQQIGRRRSANRIEKVIYYWKSHTAPRRRSSRDPRPGH